VWHRRAGKDEIALHEAAVAAHHRPATYWHMLPEYAQARKAIWNAVNPHTGKRRIDEAFPMELRANTNDHEMFIRFKSGATWQVVGSDRYNAAVGTPPAGIVFSEWALSNPAAWGYLAPILLENRGWARFITTPRGRNHVKKLLDMARGNPAWFAQVLTITDTGAVSLEAGQFHRSRRHHASGNVLLHVENVLDLGIIRFGPDASSRRGLGQLHVDAEAISGAAGAAIEEVENVQHSPDFSGRQVSVFQLKTRRFGDDEQVREATERGDDVLSDPGAKEILTGIARQVLEGQHRHRKAPGQTMRRSEASDFDWRRRRGAQPEQISAHTRIKRPHSKACHDESRCPRGCQQ
jgi:hypothetical protein